MTREESINQLNFMMEIMPKEPPLECDGAKEWMDADKDIRTTFKMAIEALEQEPCEDAISRKRVLNTLFYNSDNNCEVVLNKELQDRIKSLPPVKPARKKGKWIYTGDYITDGMLKCSECGFEHDVSESFSYCPNCGAEMKSKGEKE